MESRADVVCCADCTKEDFVSAHIAQSNCMKMTHNRFFCVHKSSAGRRAHRFASFGMKKWAFRFAK